MSQLTPQSLERISEYVQKGIAASKQSESNFWGEVKKQMGEMHDTLLVLNNNFESMVDQNRIRNGRIEKLEERTEITEKKIYGRTMWIAGISILLPIVLVLISYIFTTSIANLSKQIELIPPHVNAETK